MERLDYLVVGHIAKDVLEKGFALGGTAVYSAVAATRLGRQVAVVTACEPGIDLQPALAATAVSFAPSLTSTVFKNVYQAGEREQYLLSRAAALGSRDVPVHWRTSRLVHLAPIAQELSPEIVDLFEGTFIGLTAQGWLRGWDDSGKVFFRPWDSAALVLPKVSAVVLSEEDVANRTDVIDYFAGLAPVLAITMGSKGARVHWDEGWKAFPAFPAKTIDPTGAGDVFATAFFHRLEQTKDPEVAATFASCAASFAVEAQGWAGLPTQEMVERRLWETRSPGSLQ